MLPNEDVRISALRDAERKANLLYDRIEQSNIIAPGRTEHDVEREIYKLAKAEFGLVRYWHGRIVRCGSNTIEPARRDAPNLTIAEDDIVFIDLGPVFEKWEADVGRTYVVGSDPQKVALVQDLPKIFELVRRRYLEHPEISGSELYHYAVACAEKAGWGFGGKIAGHIVGEFPHPHVPDNRTNHHIHPKNVTSMSAPDEQGRYRYWICEIHLVSPDNKFGGFYERLLIGN